MFFLQGDDGGSLLHLVCKEKEVKVDLVKMLLERGLNAAKRDKVTLTTIRSEIVTVDIAVTIFYIVSLENCHWIMCPMRRRKQRCLN